MITVGDMRLALPFMPEHAYDAVITDPPYELGFMGKDWDRSGVAFSPATWEAAYRVMKPGAYLMAFGGSRTSHRIACAIEDAGFVIRDTLQWLYGSGMPHGLDVSKAIDNAAGATRRIVGVHPNPAGNKVGGNALNMSRTGMPTTAYLTEPETALARLWSGWGTQLKPAHEPIILAQKPLSGTYADNIARWGCGALNVEGCKVGDAIVRTQGGDKFPNLYGAYGTATESEHVGRFPPNVLLDYEAARAIDVQGDGASQFFPVFSYEPGDMWSFLYTAKASPSERGESNSHATVKPVSLMRWLCKLIARPGMRVLDPFGGSGTTLVAGFREGIDVDVIELIEDHAAITSARYAREVSDFHIRGLVQGRKGFR